LSHILKKKIISPTVLIFITNSVFSSYVRNFDSPFFPGPCAIKHVIFTLCGTLLSFVHWIKSRSMSQLLRTERIVY